MVPLKMDEIAAISVKSSEIHAISLKSLTSRDFTEIDRKQKPLKTALTTIHYATKILKSALVLHTITMEIVCILVEYDAQNSKILRNPPEQ